MKRLICSLDGTWNDDDGASPLTNVAKLNRAIPFEDPNGVRQLVRYVVGIATSQSHGLSFLKGALGFEIGDRIKAAYQFLSNVYEPGDEIYLFGFSRGAYEARSLASFITLFGIARKDSGFLIDDAWRVYRKSERERNFDTVAEIGANCHYPVRIRCLGLWDTVENVGTSFWPPAWLRRKFDPHDMRMHDTIDVALHALSIDEARGSFRPTLFSYPDDIELPAHQHVEQSWFAGTHADVGGGWPETALSDIALLWMAERILATTDLAIDIDKLQRESSPDHLGLQHYSSIGWLHAVSRMAPYLRPIRQSLKGHDAPRRWRTHRLGAGLASLNETVHQSALMRLGKTVKEARANILQDIVYGPPTLVEAANNAVPMTPEPAPKVRRPRPTPPLTAAAPAAPAAPVFNRVALEPIAEPMPSPSSLAPDHQAAEPAIEPANDGGSDPYPERSAEILQTETLQTENPAAVHQNGATNDLREGVDMPETSSALKARDPVMTNEPSSSPLASTPAKIKVVTVHGTGAGAPDDAGLSWWQKDSAFQKKTAEIVELAGDGIEVVPFHWGTGPNSETKRREAGAKLYEQLRGFDEAGIDYHLIGHSHGGSVIYDALLRSAANGAPLERLKSWLTVGTPFLDFKPSWLLFNRLNIWGQVVYMTGVGILFLAIGILASKYFNLPFAQMVTATLGEKAFANFYYPILSFLVGYAIMCFGILTAIERLTKRWYSDHDKTTVRDLYEKKWVGLWHHDDEAISALANVKALHRAIIPSNFLVPVFSLIPLLMTIFGLVYAFFYLVHSWNIDAQWLKNIFTNLATVDADPKNDWTIHSILSTIWALTTAVTVIMGPIIGIYLLITTIGIGLSRAFAHLIGIPLAKAIDHLVWDSVRQETWGNDRRGESVRSVSPTPPLFSPRYRPLPEAVALKISKYSETHATETLRKARELLGMTATSTAMGDIGRDLSQQLSWRELIHTSYFEIEEFIALLAAALRSNGLSAPKAAKLAEAISDDMAAGWLRDISTLPQPLPADEVRSKA